MDQTTPPETSSVINHETSSSTTVTATKPTNVVEINREFTFLASRQVGPESRQRCHLTLIISPEGTILGTEYRDLDEPPIPVK